MSARAAQPLTWQPSLLGAEPSSGPTPEAASCVPQVRQSFERAMAAADHLVLSDGAWIDVATNVVAHGDALFEAVLECAPWASYERPMYDRIVVEPRLTTRAWPDPPAAVSTLAEVLSDHYGLDLRAVSANLYRTGADSVAWHGDRIRHRPEGNIVAILSLGSPRRFLLRPKHGGGSLRFTPRCGDLLVMGGTCQRTWEHCVPKCASAGPRISVMFRERSIA
jgi:alkylated DNA repair dioxygenase AlkB